MSFNEPFINKYTKGDLFYGFQKPRSALMRQLGINVGDQSLNALWTINNYMITSSEVASIPGKLAISLPKLDDEELERLKASDTDWDAVKGKGFKDPAKQAVLGRLNDTVAKSQAERKAALLRPHAELKEALESYKGGKYKYAIDHKPDPLAADKDLENAKQNSAWRKKCKGGIYYAIFIAKTNVHFCLGESEDSSGSGTFKEMNYLDVVNKSDPFDKPATDTSHKFHVITPAELRWIYRNRESSEVQQHVQFWRRDASAWVPCGPPWRDSGQIAEEAWASYKPKSSNVHSNVD